MIEFTIRQISAAETIPLRHSVLRPHQPLAACHYPGDEDEINFHIGAFYNEDLVSVASYFLQKHPELAETPQYRLRGMATLPELRGEGAGSQLLVKGNEILREKIVPIWWCNARISAAGYYEKAGLSQLGEVFEIKPIGMHKVMYLRLAPRQK